MVIVAFCLIAGVGWVVTSQLLGVAIKLPNYRTNIRDKIIAAHKPTEGSLGQAVKMIEDIGEEAIAGTSSAAATQATDTTPHPEAVKPTQVQVVEPVGNQFIAIRSIVPPLTEVRWNGDHRSRLHNLYARESERTCVTGFFFSQV